MPPVFSCYVYMLLHKNMFSGEIVSSQESVKYRQKHALILFLWIFSGFSVFSSDLFSVFGVKLGAIYWGWDKWGGGNQKVFGLYSWHFHRWLYLFFTTPCETCTIIVLFCSWVTWNSGSMVMGAPLGKLKEKTTIHSPQGLPPKPVLFCLVSTPRLPNARGLASRRSESRCGLASGILDGWQLWSSETMGLSCIFQMWSFLLFIMDARFSSFSQSYLYVRTCAHTHAHTHTHPCMWVGGKWRRETAKVHVKFKWSCVLVPVAITMCHRLRDL